MAKEKKKELSYAERNKERVERLLEDDPASVRAVSARTVETKKLAGKLFVIDIIFNNARQNLGHTVSFEDFKTLFEEFEKADKALDTLIEKATEVGIYKPRVIKPKFSDFKNSIKEMLSNDKSFEEIQKAVTKVDEDTLKAWIKLVEADMPKTDKKTEDTTEEKKVVKKTVAKTKKEEDK